MSSARIVKNLRVSYNSENIYIRTCNIAKKKKSTSSWLMWARTKIEGAKFTMVTLKFLTLLNYYTTLVILLIFITCII